MAEQSPNPIASSSDSSHSLGQQIRNLLIVIAATLLTLAVFFGFRTQATTVSLDALAETSVPLEVALKNQKPTLMEFYANWCTSCQAMAGDLSELKDQYGDQINFVMLNVDNSKWLPEMLHYRVDGIPHFVFLNNGGETIAAAIGEQPRTIMAENLAALVSNRPLPYARSVGQTSAVQTPTAPSSRPDDPRSHGSQVTDNG